MNQRVGLLLVIPLFLASCGLWESTTAIIWTDTPEFALYAEYFNSSQGKYKIEARYFESPAQMLTSSREHPDIVIGAWLKSASTRTYFQPLDKLLKKGIPAEAFYSRLLALGNIDKRQYLFPVSFNIPTIVFAQNNEQSLSSQFVISPEEIRSLGKGYNQESRGAYTHIGFSPLWDREFLSTMARIFDVSFREASPVAWESDALEQCVQYLQEWIRDANTSAAAEDEFTFKYFFIPPAKLATSRRILFTYMMSSDFFTLPEEQRKDLAFRWIAGGENIPLAEEAVYYGICKAGKAKQAAFAFTQWFFHEDSQRILLEECKNKRILESRFGIANGFSALKTVTEQIFPQYYPSLLGHMPPEAYLSPANILPQNWMAMKEQVILPYLHERIRNNPPEDRQSLERRISSWVRIN